MGAAEGLWIVNADGTGWAVLADIGPMGAFAWAPPNNSRIAYMRPDGLWVMGLHGTDRTLVVDWGGGEYMNSPGEVTSSLFELCSTRKAGSSPRRPGRFGRILISCDSPEETGKTQHCVRHTR